jgi:mRNA interferase RelE/StbE
MEKFNLSFKKSAEKELRAVPNPPLKFILRKIEALAIQPRPREAVMLKGGEKYFRIRQGDYRIVYEVRDADQAVVIIKIGHRREVYG